ncbi:MAG: glycosyltransferase [Oscillospiraceae bacterium]|nr:glycosyltransferase [Oscillospiraceae bacterium]
MDDIKVSISVLSYKHGPYVRKCLDSLLAQKVNFRYEIVVGEDFSNDGTREILLEYKEKYPDIFTLLLNDENVGAARNNHNIKLHCRGKYIATCESDDFWIDENKLQRQVDFLEAHPEYVGIAANYVNVNVEGKNPRVQLMSWQLNKRYRLKDYLRYGLPSHGSTMVHRNIIPYTDERYVKLRFSAPTMGDVLTHALLLDYGDIYMESAITLAHRSGAATPTSFSAQQKKKAMDFTRMYFNIVDSLNVYFDGKHDFTPLKANRVGAMLRSGLSGNLEIDKADMKALLKEMPLKLRLLCYSRCIQKTWRNLLHKLGRKLSRKVVKL